MKQKKRSPGFGLLFYWKFNRIVALLEFSASNVLKKKIPLFFSKTKRYDF